MSRERRMNACALSPNAKNNRQVLLIREHGKELSHYALWAKIQYGGQNVITLLIQITTFLDLFSQNMSQNFYSVALAVLAAILVRWCVSLSSYSGKIISCLISLS